jgi:preprotein translocase subunit SecA
MASMTVGQLAKQVGIPVDRVLLLLGESGLPHTDPLEVINDEDRMRLLVHLRGMQGGATRTSVTRPRSARSPRVTAPDPAGENPRPERETVIIQVRKRRTLRMPGDEERAEDAVFEPVVESPPLSVVTTTDREFDEAKRVLHEEAKRRSQDVDPLIRADTEAREKAELLESRAKPRMTPRPVSRAPFNSSENGLSQAPDTSSAESLDEAAKVIAREAAKEATRNAVPNVAAGQMRPGEAHSATQAANAGVESVQSSGSATPRVNSDSTPEPLLVDPKKSAKAEKPAHLGRAQRRRLRKFSGADSAAGESGAAQLDAEHDPRRAADGDHGRRQQKPSKSGHIAAGAVAREGFAWGKRPVRTSAELRPGILTGTYPEREDTRDSWLERTAASTIGWLRQHVGGGRPRYQHFVQQVHAAADGMDELDDPALSRLVPELRRRLYSEGFTDALVSQSFAIVREMATRRLNMRHYDVQLYGGWIMLNGMISEMETGEGKTLTATLTAATVALAGVPVHVVTVNDFLVQRDAAWMRPLYRALGLTVGTITEDMEPDDRRKAYACDITYCTNKQLVFDYLKDRLVLGADSRRLQMQLETLHSDVPRTGRLLLRGLCFAIVDEADSVLVDEARTPLVISKAGDTAQQEKTYRDAIRVARQLRGGRDFEVRTRDRRVELSEPGKKRAALLTRELKGMWSGARRRESLMRQALAAIHLFQAEKHYLVTDGKVQIVDEYTGRVMADRSWEGGLHQMIQAKEGVEITGQQETLARISYQRFFRRYLRVSGMTGTAHEVARELWSVYRLNVVSVPTNRPARRGQLADAVYVDDEHKWQAVVRDIREQNKSRRPILVGTRSVGASEHLSELLHAAHLEHVVLNARQDQHEAEVVAMAGQAGRITVATNMAGRGTDIRLAPGVADNGGLHVLATERHESARIDRQLFGRGARQGDPGSYRCIVSLEDELVSDFWPQKVLRMLGVLSVNGRLPGWLGAAVVGLAQRSAEGNHGRTRRDLLRLDDNLGDMLAFSGRGE